MRHKVGTTRLNRSTDHRKALIRNLARTVVLHGFITTTETKAKAIKPVVEKLVTKARAQTLHARRQIQAFFNEKIVTERLFDVITPQIVAKRKSGFLQLTHLGPRKGDNSMMVMLKFTDEIAQVETTSTTTKDNTKSEK